MAKIKFKADKADETTGGGGGNFEPAPRGIYTLQVADYTQGETTSANAKNPGVPKTRLTCEIADEGPEFGKKVWHTVTWISRGTGDKATPGHGIAIHFLHAVGMTFDGQFEFDESDFQGRKFRALLEVEEYETVKDGKTYTNQKNVVREVYTDAHPEPSELPAPPTKKKAAASTNGAKQPVAAGTGPQPDQGW